jgi:alpha-galactosidase
MKLPLLRRGLRWRAATGPSISVSLLITLLLITSSLVPAADLQPGDSAAIHRWTEAKFGGHSEERPSQPSLLLATLKPTFLARGNISGRRFTIAEQTFADGIAMRSPGELVMDAPKGISRFRAVLGVDSNDIGYYSNAGRGSVIASIAVGSSVVYRSPVLHEGLSGIPIDVDLKGAPRVSLRLEHVGVRSPTYQNEWDQADWADATINLNDGRVQPLSQLQIGPLPAAESPDPPFSFILDGKLSSNILKEWQVHREQHRIDKTRTEYDFIYSEPASRLSIRGVAIAYNDFSTVEWTLYFRNDSSSPSPIFENIRPLDATFDLGNETQVKVHHSRGSMALATDFQPLTDPLATGETQHFSSQGGRPTDGDMPYFNLEWLHRGLIAAIGWPGQWDLTLSREHAAGVRIVGGQSATHFRLMPGEEVRTPLVVVQFWTGDWIDGQNLWRQWMNRYNLPRPGGHLPPPQVSAGSAHFTVEMQEANEANQKKFLLGMLNDGLPVDHWWMDAGWYRYQKNWSKVGTWEIDKLRFPNGLKPITDLGHQHNVKSILWFEPERVTEGTWLATEHPEWLIGPSGQDKLLFLGNKDAWRWLVDRISNIISENGLDVYRQDFNFEPLSRWNANDSADRQGISEIEHVVGYLSFLDELRRRFPNLLIDTCASGGRRLDLETLRRAVPLWRSDYPYGATPMQMQTFGLALWIPYFGTSAGSLDPYTFRSEMTPAIGIGPDPKVHGERLKVQLDLLAEWREVSAFYSGDFYPLTEYSQDETAWIAWQWSRTNRSASIVQAFRRSQSPFSVAKFRLRDVDQEANYSIEDLDSHRKIEVSGKSLSTDGLPIEIDESPGSVILKLERTATSSADSSSKLHE